MSSVCNNPIKTCGRPMRKDVSRPVGYGAPMVPGQGIGGTRHALLAEQIRIRHIRKALACAADGLFRERCEAELAASMARASHLAPGIPVREVMSGDIKYCFEDQDVDEVAANMAKLEIRRLPVVNREKRLVGIIALSNMAFSEEPDSTKVYLESVACPH